jgi:hypothetical protein
MKKYLLLMAAGIFGILTASAWTVTFTTGANGGKVATITSQSPNSDNWSDINYTNGNANDLLSADTLIFISTAQTPISSLQAFQGKNNSEQEPYFKASKVDFSGATFTETTVGTVNYQAWNPTSKTYEAATVTKTSNCMSFQHFPNCSIAVLASVKTLCQSTFDNNFQMTTTFEIPSSVEYIAGHAVDDTPIHDITIPATVKYIEAQAFQNAKIDNLIEVTVEGYTSAAHGAFDKDVTVGQTQADGTRIYATLHFPAGSEEFFTNTQHELDLATSLDAGLFQNWLNQHYEGSGNGWQDFINSGPGKGIPLDKPVVLRTFSDNVAHYVPLCYRAYIVNGVTQKSDGSYELLLTEIFGIPANTGVIIYGEAESGSFALPILSGASWKTDPYDRTARTTQSNGKTINLQNYLVANCTLASGTKIGPYELGTDGEVAERNFVMGPYSKTDMGKDASTAITNGTDYVAFFRAKTMTPGSNKAHLKLPNSIFAEPKGAEVLAVNPDKSDNAFRKAEWIRDFAEYGDWGTKPGSLPPFMAKSFGEPNEEATGISNVTVENAEDGAIYTLQGVKVENPSKGVYIQNGKKFIVK